MTARAAAYRSPPGKPRLTAPHPTGQIFGWALPLYLLLLSGGFAFLRSPMAAIRGGELSIDRAAFASINAVTGTGFSQTVGQDELKPAGQCAITLLIAGGAALSLSIGGTMVNCIAGRAYSQKTILTTSIAMIAGAALIGAATLGDSAWHGAAQGIGAISNCGLVLSGVLGKANSASTMLVLLPLSVIGGLGVVVVLECANALSRKRLSAHSAAVLSMSGAIYIAGTVALLFLGTPGAEASAMAINSRSAGFNLLPIDTLGRGGQWIVLALMAIGAAPGGTGGGLKVTTPLVLWRGARQSYRGSPGGRIFIIAIVWSAAFGLLLFLGTLVLVLLQPQLPTDRLLFLAVSAASNTGLSNDPVSMVGGGLISLGVIALLGRVLPMGVLWWCCSVGKSEDQVAVG